MYLKKLYKNKTCKMKLEKDKNQNVVSIMV